MINDKKNIFKAEDGALGYALSIIMLLVMQLLCSGIIMGIKEDTVLYDTIYGGLGILLQLGNAAVILLLMLKYKKVPTIFIKKRTKLTNILLGAGFGVLCLVCFYPIASAWMIFLYKIGYPIDGGIKLDTPLQVILIIISACILAPVLEEIIYRSFLLSGLEKIFGSITSAIICGILFAFMHMNPEQTVYQFCLGAACALLALSTQSVLPAVTLHLVSNLVVVLARVTPLSKAFILYENFFAKNVAIWVVSSVLLLAIGGAIIYFVCSFINKKRLASTNSGNDLTDGNLINSNLVDKEGRGRFIKMMVLGLAISLGMWILMLFAGIAL